jgi:hypothetical protein
VRAEHCRCAGHTRVYSLNKFKTDIEAAGTAEPLFQLDPVTSQTDSIYFFGIDPVRVSDVCAHTVVRSDLEYRVEQVAFHRFIQDENVRHPRHHANGVRHHAESDESLVR